MSILAPDWTFAASLAGTGSYEKPLEGVGGPTRYIAESDIWGWERNECCHSVSLDSGSLALWRQVPPMIRHFS